MSLRDLREKLENAFDNCEKAIENENCARDCFACPIHEEMNEIKERIEKEFSRAYELAIKIVEECLKEKPDVNGNVLGELNVWSFPFSQFSNLVLRISLIRERKKDC